MSYNDDAKMKLLKEAWAKMEEGETVKNPNTTGKIIANAKTTPAPKGLEGTKVTGTGVKQGPGGRDKVATAPVGENLSEGEEELGGDTGAPAGAADIGGGDAGAVDADAAMGGMDTGMDAGMGAAPVGSPWDQLVAAVEQMKVALEAIAAEEGGEAGGAVGGDPMGGDAGVDPMGGEAGGAPEDDISAVAEQYLEEAKKKLKEKAACKEENKGKGFVPGKKGVNPFPKKK